MAVDATPHRARVVVASSGESALAAFAILDVRGIPTYLVGSPAQLETALDTRHFDVAIIFDDMVVGETIGLVSRIHALHPQVCIILVQTMPDITDAVMAAHAGAAFAFSVPIDGADLARRVRSMLGLDYIVITDDDEDRRAVPLRGRFPRLTPREKQVVGLIVGGRTNKQVGRELGISPRTVEVHRAHAMEKLDARNTADLIRISLSRKLN
jgi:FixJ family two-component response regulator